MATADLKLIYGGGGAFKPTFFSGVQNIASGSSGTLLTLTAPAGKKVRLTSLGCLAGFSETNITVTTDTGAVVTALTLQGSPTNAIGSFAVGQMSVTTGGGSPSFVPIDYIDSISTIIITKTVGSTANDIYYSYAYGD